MGLKEQLMTDWKDKTIEYQERKFYILDQFNFENTEYLYCINIDTVNNKNPEVAFLYKKNGEIFEHVENKELFEELLINVSGRLVAEKIEEDLKKITNN